MSDVLNLLLQEIAQGDHVKDWAHASKLFVTNDYELTPKSAFLYFVHFDFNSDVVTKSPQTSGMNQRNNQTELGMMVKQVSLPKYTIDTKTLNAYNRPHVVQTKIHYDPINIVFHDDSANRVRNFWFDYYTYYYRTSDPTYSTALGSHSEITNPRLLPNWGYTIRNTTNTSTTSGYLTTPPAYINSIKIYSLFNKKFSEYVLINPIIKSFQHGDHAASEGTGVLQHQMTIEYESVAYGYGSVNKNSVTGFADTHYDKSPSPLLPLGGGTQSILGPGGIISDAATIANDLATGQNLAAALASARVKNGLKGINLSNVIKSEALSSAKGMLAGNNPFSSISIPGLGGQ